MNQNIPIGDYLRRTVRTIDGIVWLGICVLSLLAGADLALQLGWIPLRESQDLAKAAVLLAFSPLLTFLLLVVSRLLPASRGSIAEVVRALIIIFFFAILNF